MAADSRFVSPADARACIARQPFFCGVMFDLHAAKCVGMASFIVVVCTATRNRGRQTCTTADDVDSFVARFRR